METCRTGAGNSIRDLNAGESVDGESPFFLPCPEPVTCPYEKDLLKSMRLQGIIMQQMRDEISKNRQVFKVFLKPTAKTLNARAEKSCCTGDVTMVEEMVDELSRDLEKVKCELEQVREHERDYSAKEYDESQCTCGLSPEKVIRHSRSFQKRLLL